MASSKLTIEKMVVLLEAALLRDIGATLYDRNGMTQCLLVQERSSDGYPWRLYTWNEEEDIRGELLKEGTLLEVCEDADERGFLDSC